MVVTRSPETRGESAEIGPGLLPGGMPWIKMKMDEPLDDELETQWVAHGDYRVRWDRESAAVMQTAIIVCAQPCILARTDRTENLGHSRSRYGTRET